MTHMISYQLSDAASEWMTTALSGEQLLALVTTQPQIQEYICRGGFKATARNLERSALRRRFAMALTRDPGLAERILLGPEHPWARAAEALEALDEGWFLSHWRELVRRREGPALAAAMAIDERPGIRQRGMRLLRAQGPWRTEGAERAKDAPTVLSYFGAGSDGRLEADTDADDAQGRVLALGHEVASVREALERQRHKVRELEQQQRQDAAKVDERERTLRRELRDAMHEAATVRADIPQRVSAQVEDFKRQLMEASQPAPALPDSDLGETDELLKRVEQTIAAQEQLNEAFGTREAVRRRIGLLGDAATRLATCIEESIRIHPEVRGLHAAVCREIDRLRDSIQDEADEAHAPELAAQVAAMLKATPLAPAGLQHLSEIHRLLGQPLIAELLGDGARKRLDAAIDQRRRLTLELMQGVDDQPGPREPRESREIWDVAAELARGGGDRVAVFIDGYNVTKRVLVLLRIEEREGLTRSRETLCALCRNQAHRFGHMEAVFDGVGALSVREDRGGMILVFSNGLKESQNADDYLIDRLSTEHEREWICWLVSDDAGLRRRALPFCKAFVSTGDWHHFITHPGSTPPASKA